MCVSQTRQNTDKCIEQEPESDTMPEYSNRP